MTWPNHFLHDHFEAARPCARVAVAPNECRGWGCSSSVSRSVQGKGSKRVHGGRQPPLKSGIVGGREGGTGHADVGTCGKSLYRPLRTVRFCVLLNSLKAGKKHHARGKSEPESLRPEMEPSSAQYTSDAVFSCGTRFFVHGNQRSDCPSSRDGPYRSVSRYFGS